MLVATVVPVPLEVRGQPAAEAGTASITLLQRGLFLVEPLPEANVVSQFTAWYVLLSLANAALGVYLFKRSRRETEARGFTPPK